MGGGQQAGERLLSARWGAGGGRKAVGSGDTQSTGQMRSGRQEVCGWRRYIGYVTRPLLCCPVNEHPEGRSCDRAACKSCMSTATRLVRQAGPHPCLPFASPTRAIGFKTAPKPRAPAAPAARSPPPGGTAATWRSGRARSPAGDGADADAERRPSGRCRGRGSRCPRRWRNRSRRRGRWGGPRARRPRIPGATPSGS